jgi:hypothetical protein
MAVVAPDERSAASGITASRAIGASLAGFAAVPGEPCAAGSTFVLSGSLKIIYDLSLYRSFRDEAERSSTTVKADGFIASRRGAERRNKDL